MNKANRFRLTGLLTGWIILSAALPSQEAARLYANGEFLKAASVAETVKTASSIALAARALLAHAIYVANPSLRAVEVQRGTELARKALALNPDYVEAHLQLVIALHEQARATTLANAYIQGYAAKARSHLEIALRKDQNNPWVQALLGGWHFEIVRLAGPYLARILFGAKLTEGRAAFTKAITLTPGNIVVQYEFARALLLNDTAKNQAEAVQLLTSTVEATPANYLDKMIVTHARAVLDAIKSGFSVDLSQPQY